MGLTYAYPLRPWSYAKIDSGFLDPAYYGAYKKWHRGLDINGKYGGATDLGYPVQAMFPGRVIGVDERSTYGKSVLIRADEKTLADARSVFGGVVTTLEPFYAHLHHVTVGIGDTVKAGDHIGSIGGTGGSYTPHLHLEVRIKAEPMIVSQGGTHQDRERVEATCIDPRKVMLSMRFTDFGVEADAPDEPTPFPKSTKPEPDPEPTPEPTPPPYEVVAQWRRLALVVLRESSK